MLGDFNARVGVLDEDSSLWQSVLGRHQGAWTHSATKKCHVIDFVVMRAEQRVFAKM